MIRVVSTLDECRALWEAFSPHERVWDEWDVMQAYHDESQYELAFAAREGEQGRPDAMIPLVHDKKGDSYELFGGCYADNRLLWVPPQDFPEFFDHFPEKTEFFDLNGACVQEILRVSPQYTDNFRETDQRYFLVPAAFDYDFNNHINTFSGDKRSGFLYDLRKIRGRNPEINWSTDDETELFIALCNNNFGAESDYITEAGQAEIRRVIQTLQRLGYLRTLTIAIDGKKEAVAMSILYKNTMIAAYAASNNNHKNLGKLLNVENIQEGCRLKVDEVNYMTGMQWKAFWKMNSETCHTMRKPAKPAEPA